MCKHKIIKLRESMYLRGGKLIDVEIWQCEYCKKYLIIDLKTGGKTTLNNELGEEIGD